MIYPRIHVRFYFVVAGYRYYLHIPSNILVLLKLYGSAVNQLRIYAKKLFWSLK